MPSKKHLGTITILLKDRHNYAIDTQKIFTEHGKMILARTGVNPSRTCVKNCTGLIVLLVEGTVTEISDLTKKLNKLYGVVAKKIIITD
ncbi:hypothetical protein KKH39_05300 [Patescibacteria group bacterium]|nr:hypothetical protein [Patescibacteria group bacterium]